MKVDSQTKTTKKAAIAEKIVTLSKISHPAVMITSHIIKGRTIAVIRMVYQEWYFTNSLEEILNSPGYIMT